MPINPQTFQAIKCYLVKNDIATIFCNERFQLREFAYGGCIMEKMNVRNAVVFK